MQTYESSAGDAVILSTQIAAAKEQSSSGLSQVQAVADDAERLQRDVVTVQEMADLDGESGLSSFQTFVTSSSSFQCFLRVRPVELFCT